MTFGLILTVVVAFGFMIFIHESGHYLACRFFGVRVERFAIGFGPKIWACRIGDTEYALLAVPLGGYCKPAGGDLSTDPAEKVGAAPPKPGEFLYASWWRRVLIFLAGPSMNFLSAVLILAFVVFWGERIPVEEAVLGFVPPGSLAEKAGLRPGDRLVSVSGRPVKNLYTDLEPLYEGLLAAPEQGVAVVLQRDGRKIERTVRGNPAEPGVSLGLNARIPPVLGAVHLMSPARKAGLRKGDRVLSVNDVAVSEWAEVAWHIRRAESDPIRLVVERGGEEYPVSVNRVFNGIQRAIGISPVDSEVFEVRREGPLSALASGWRRAVAFSAFFGESLAKLVTGKIPIRDNLAGPFTIVRTLYEKAEQDLREFCNTVAVISLILCWMNLLPIPVVDGGQVVLCLAEAARRGPVPVKWQVRYQQVGFALILLLMGIAVFNDVWGLIAEKMKSQIP